MGGIAQVSWIEDSTHYEFNIQFIQLYNVQMSSCFSLNPSYVIAAHPVHSHHILNPLPQISHLRCLQLLHVPALQCPCLTAIE